MKVHVLPLSSATSLRELAKPVLKAAVPAMAPTVPPV